MCICTVRVHCSMYMYAKTQYCYTFLLHVSLITVSLFILGLSEQPLIHTVYKDSLISEECHYIAILQSEFPEISGSGLTQLAVTQQETNWGTEVGQTHI